MKNRLYNSNNCAVIGEDGNVAQVTNFYPFGGVFSTTAYNRGDDLQPYKYNGKELDCTHGLDWYDYGARNYDVALCRWHNIDPLCEKYYHISPYVYCANNPIKFIDPTGMMYGDYYNLKGKWIGTDGIDDKKEYIVIDKKEQKNVEKATKNGKTTSVKDVESAVPEPSQDIMSQSETCYVNADANNSEFGFIAGKQGQKSDIVSGGQDEVVLGPEFTKMGLKNTSFDVHVHNHIQYDESGNIVFGIPTPSGFEENAKGQNDRQTRRNRENCEGGAIVNQLSWVWGYDIDTGIRVVTFYNSQKMFGPIKWDT